MRRFILSTAKKIARASTFVHLNRNLLESPRTRVAHIEFTSRCNLRCVYCPASRPLYQNADIDTQILAGVTTALKKRNVDIVCVNGGGETTLFKDWHRYCDRLLDDGMSLVIISNFAKKFSGEELDTLSRFKSIEISCDTCEPGLFKQLRRGNDLRTICANIASLKAAAVKKRRRLPALSFSCVVSDLNIFHLADFAAFGKELGISHFNFCNLTKYPDLKDALNPKHITELSPVLLLKARESLNETFKFLRDSGIEYHVQQGLFDSLEHKINTLNAPCPTPPSPPLAANTFHRYTSPQQQGQTRDCLDPWEFVMIRANAQVLPCCKHAPVYALGNRQSLLEVFDNIPMQTLRKRLLVGDLPIDCLNCTTRGWTSTHNLQKKVRDYLNPGRRLFFFKKPYIKIGTPRAFDLTYESGWYDLETDTSIEDPGCRQWRWTAKQARCTLVNPRGDALLIFRGSRPLSILLEQSITLKLNSSLLDEFRIQTPHFYIEYVIPAQRMGKDKHTILEISAGKTFIPSVVDPQATDNRELGIQVYDLFFGEKN